MSEKKMKVVRDHLDAFASKDWTRYRQTLRPNAIYQELATNRKVEGADAYLKALETWTTAFPDLKPTIRHLYAEEDLAIAEIRWEGTHKGLLKGAFGEVPATGKRGVVDAVQVFRFDGDKIAEARHYFDLMTVLDQVGVPTTNLIPEPTLT
jgi:steroid delta-isomerase-like uncharacterized protein